MPSTYYCGAPFAVGHLYIDTRSCLGHRDKYYSVDVAVVNTPSNVLGAISEMVMMINVPDMKLDLISAHCVPPYPGTNRSSNEPSSVHLGQYVCEAHARLL